MIESIILSLIAVIAACFAVEIIWAGWPEFGAMAHGVVPHLNPRNLYIAIGILGATVMPHNLYLHSSPGPDAANRAKRDRKTRRLPL